ncbi:hypothetical protein TSUD_410030 [Trifolium subterraneum]|uniref:HAT C-terminal dimerisation domain-containing protein n=1 Tax=Trifolium subterraneum TaxID=3900 RepID=A0A2Z6P2B9_TRISU|nr:hypothetical protein TSUD_410030 [Trifolium subterraneum]
MNVDDIPTNAMENPIDMLILMKTHKVKRQVTPKTLLNVLVLGIILQKKKYGCLDGNTLLKDSSISKIRAACKHVKASPARLTLFKVCVKDANISSSQKVITDVATRWNSTYLMLEVATIIQSKVMLLLWVLEVTWILDALHRVRVKRKQSEQKSSELVIYKEDEVEDDYEGFEILKWWKSKTTKYCILSLMARDILTIPISTVSSESTFSTVGRVLDPYRSSLKAETVEPLICTQNWIKPVTRFVLDENKAFDVVEIETEMSDYIGLEDEEPAVESLDD